MTLSVSEASVPAFRAGLGSMAAVLDRTLAQCAERKIDPAVLISDRLAPDMFPFTRQVQIAADFAKNTVAQLAGREVSRFKDVETSAPELHDRASAYRKCPARSR